MGIDPTAIKQLGDAGGLALAAALVIAIFVGAVRGWWVAGFVYRREVKRGDDATGALRALLESLADGRRPSTRPSREPRDA